MGISVMVVLLLVVMPALLYLVGVGVTRFTKKAPSWIDFPAPRPERDGKPGSKPQVRTKT